jgi:Geminivirus Rep catalytic domain
MLDHKMRDCLPKYILTCQENHQEDEDKPDLDPRHCHAIVVCELPIRTRSCKYFDIEENGKQFHANVKPITTDLRAAVRYVKKEMNIFEWGELPKTKADEKV